MDIGKAIQKIRKAQSLSQGELAKRCGLSQTSLSLIEKGQSRPSQRNLQTICQILSIPETIIYLYALEEKDVPEKKKELFKYLFPEIERMITKIVEVNS